MYIHVGICICIRQHLYVCVFCTYLNVQMYVPILTPAKAREEKAFGYPFIVSTSLPQHRITQDHVLCRSGLIDSLLLGNHHFLTLVSMLGVIGSYNYVQLLMWVLEIPTPLPYKESPLTY